MSAKSSAVRALPNRIGGIAFLFAAGLAAIVIWWTERLDFDAHQTQIGQLAGDKAHEVESAVERALTSTVALAALVHQGGGGIRDFEAVATEMLPFYPGVDSLQLAPAGVIRQIVPLAGNEKAIGHDLLKDPTRTKEAFLARDTGKLTLAGPFNLMQGGLGAVGRMPVFLPEGGGGREQFWGFTTALIRFPAVLEAAQLDQLEARDLAYELWRTHPDTGERQVIAASSRALTAEAVQRELRMPNGRWILSVTPVKGWGNTLNTIIKIALGTVFSLMVGGMARQMAELRAHRGQLQRLVAARTAALAAREEDLNRAQAVAQTGSWVYAVRGDRMTLSKQTCRILGLIESSSLSYEEFLVQVHPEDRVAVDRAWKAAIDGTPFDVVHRILVGSAVRWVREQAERVREEGGESARMVGTMRDISDRRLAEAQLRRLSTAVEQSPASIVITDLNGNIEYVNPQFEKVSGYAAADVIGQNPRVLKSGVKTPEEYATLWKTITSGAVWRGEFENVRSDGSHYWELASISPIQSADGAISGYVAVKEDVTFRREAERMIHEREAKLSALIGSLPDLLFVIDKDGVIVEFHTPDDALVQLPPTQFLNKRFADAFPADVVAMMAAAIAQVAQDGRSRHIEYGLDLGADRRYFNASINQLVSDLGATGGYIALARDVTEQKRAEERMREAMVVFDASNQGIMTTDADGCIASVNAAFCVITGYSSDEVIGQRPSMLRSGRQDEALDAAMRQSLEVAGKWEGEVWNRRKSGDVYPQWLTISAVRDEAGQLIKHVSLFSDITRRKEREEVIWRQANFDALTGLANRNLLHDRLERALANARRHGSKAGLIFLDLDGFKWINDTLGHDVGDEMLVEAARRLLVCVREQDTVARLGGDEFTVVVGDLTDVSDLRIIGEKILVALREPFMLAGSRRYISGSIGITAFPDDGNDVQALLRNADIAMYQSKQLGKNRCQFYARYMQENARARMQLEIELRAALEQNAFLLHYQPIVDARTGILVGAEALIRWHHPERGTVAPQDFVSIAEETGLIVPIGAWVLREVARQCNEWRGKGFAPLYMAVNISGVQFREPGLEELVRTIHAQHESEQCGLLLEITESVLMDSSDVTEKRMQAIKALGIDFALDDFGTGFSSLSYLKRFPVDIVKIDRSFVNDCPHDRSDAHLVEAIINMTHSLGLRVTAEGVETEEQLEFLRGLGCDNIQGYLVSKPLPPAEFETILGRQVLLPAYID